MFTKTICPPGIAYGACGLTEITRRRTATAQLQAPPVMRGWHTQELSLLYRDYVDTIEREADLIGWRRLWKRVEEIPIEMAIG